MKRARPIRLTVVMTHPVQYYGPWFRYIASSCPEIEINVIYATEPSPEQQGAGFGKGFSWDVPLREGYPNRVLRPAGSNASVHHSDFFGIDIKNIGDEIRADKPDVVLIHGWHSVTQVRALRACRKIGIPVLYRGDSTLRNAPTGIKKPLWRARTSSLLKYFSAYLSVGTKSREYLRSFGIPAERIFDSPHCVDNDLFRSAALAYEDSARRDELRASFGFEKNDFVVLFVGKIDANKRAADAVQAVAKLGPGAALLIAGTGELEPEVRREAERLGIKVTWAGFINQSQIGRAYAAADCLVLPSTGETWGLVVNEALAAGIPCVVSDGVGCAPDLIAPDVTGSVYPVGDISALATALGTIREKTLSGHDWRSACRERAEQHSYRAASEGLLRACEAVLDARPTPRVMALFGGMVIVAGVERISFEILRCLVKRGAAVHVIVNSWENHRIVAMADELGVPHSIGRYFVALRRRPRNPLAALRMANDIVLTSAGLLRDCLRFRPTHIFVPQFSVALVCYPAIILLRLFGVKCFLRLGNPPPPDKFYERLFRWVLAPITSLFIANSYYTRRELLSCGVPPRKVTVIFNTTPTRRTIALVTKPDPHKIVFIGQVIPPKGVHKLLDAVAILRRRGHDVNLDVVGEIEGWESPSYAGYRQKLRKRAAAPDLAGHIHFLGYREDIPARLAAGAIHCCPSTPAQREGFGIVNLEAKAAGLPSVVTPFGALPEVIEHKVDGFVCRDDSPAALAEGLEYFLSDPERRARAAEAARASAEKFSRETFSQCWWDTFTVADPALLRNRLPDPANELSDVRVMACFGAMVFVAGMERVAFEVLRVLREAGASLHVIVNGWENHRIIPWAEDLGASWSTGRYYGHLSRHARNPVALLSMLYEVSATSAGLLRDCWRFRPTHIFFPDFVSVLRNFPAVLLLRQMGKKIVLKASTAPPDHVTYQRLWKYAVSPLVDEIIGVSDFVRREVISTGVPESKVRSIYNSVTTRIPSNGRDVPRDPRKVIYVGQIHPGKGVHLLLEAIATVAKRGRDLHLDVVGDLDAWEPPNFRGYRASLVERASQPDLLGRVNFLGFREDVADCMKAAAIHCCPSLPEIKEALGLVNLEAKTCGTPSVVFCSGGVPELFRHRQDGWICEQPTADALAEGIEYFLDPVVQEKASVAARESSAAFVRQRFAEEWRSVFRQ